MSIQPSLFTTQEVLAIPDDGKERWLIRGGLREKQMILRSQAHGRVEGRIAYLLNNWAWAYANPRGEVLIGNAEIQLRKDPDTFVGVDAAYVSPQVADANPD